MTKGKKGTTIVFSIPNLSLNGTILSWDAFKFYTPVGEHEEEITGYKYFNIPSDTVLIERDSELYREVFVYCIDGALYAQGFWEGEEVSLPSFSLSGNILFKVSIPPLGTGEITIEQREVVDG